MKTPSQRILQTLTCVSLLGLAASAPAETIFQWDFNAGNFDPTSGTQPLSYFDGEGGATSLETVFGTTTALGIPNINGVPAAVMKFPACSSAMGYFMPTTPDPTGPEGAIYVNDYTLIMDLLFPNESMNTWRALIQIDGTGDADFFINTANGIGISGQYAGEIKSNTWHRVGLVMDVSNGLMRKYIDGAPVGTMAVTVTDWANRWALAPNSAVVLFTDDDNETAVGYVNSIQLRDRALNSGEMLVLGGPSAAGIPTNIVAVPSFVEQVTPASNAVGVVSTPTISAVINRGTTTINPTSVKLSLDGADLATSTTVLGDRITATASVTTPLAGQTTHFAAVRYTDSVAGAKTNTWPFTTKPTPAPILVAGHWDFNQGDLRATVGQDLQYFNAQVQADTTFGTTTSFGIADIDGQPANVLYCNPTVPASAPKNWYGYIMTHGISPNAGGVYVNQYTLIMDVLYPSSSGGYRSLWQTAEGNGNDGDLFVNGGNGIGISSQYQGDVSPDTWHRLVFTFDLVERELGKYIDGANVVTAPVGSAPLGTNLMHYLSAGVDGRWSLGPTALLFADEDGEVAPVYVSSVQIRSGTMSPDAVAALGAPTAGKIPGALKATRSGNNVVIEWTGTTLESASSLTGTWTPIAGAAHPYVVTSPTGSRFFRVR